MAGLQRARAAAGRGRADPAAGAREVLRDLHDEPRRVLHGARRRPTRPDRRRRGEPRPRRPYPLGDDRTYTRARAGAGRAAERLLRRTPAPRLGRARHPRGRRERARRRAARGAGQTLPEGDLPGVDAAGSRSGTPVSVYLKPVPQPGRARARSRDRPDGVRAREGADGDPAALRRAEGAGVGGIGSGHHHAARAWRT